MAMRLLRPADPEASAFAQAKARWGIASSKHRELRAQLDGAKAALALVQNPPTRGDIFSPIVTAKAAAFLAGRVPNVARLQAEVAAIEHQLSDAATVYASERQCWAAAVDAEAARLADLLRPRHRAAVSRIGKAVEALSAAIEGERAVRFELDALSSALPDAGHEFGTLAEYGSTLSAWNRRMLQSGLIG